MAPERTGNYSVEIRKRCSECRAYAKNCPLVALTNQNYSSNDDLWYSEPSRAGTILIRGETIHCNHGGHRGREHVGVAKLVRKGNKY